MFISFPLKMYDKNPLLLKDLDLVDWKWIHNVILKHILKEVFLLFEPFSARWLQSLHKCYNETIVFGLTFNMGLKNAEFDADFESVENIAKKFTQKS